MNKKNQAKKFAKKATALATVFGMAASLIPAVPMQVKAAEFAGKLTEVKSVEVDKDNQNIVWVTFNDAVKGKLTFLDDGIFRYNVDPSGDFSKYATPRSNNHKGRIQQFPDESNAYEHPAAEVTDADGSFTVTSGGVSVVFDKGTARMSVKQGDKTVMEETDSLSIKSNSTVQTLKKQDSENFYGGGTQNGRFVHTGESIKIAIDNAWVDGCVSSPTPFYYTTEGYGVLRNTFQTGVYDFGRANEDTVKATHSDGEFDAYYFVSDAADARGVTQEILQEYYKVTGNPALAPEYSFYVGHLNAYNRDAWSDTSGTKKWTIKGTDPADSAGVSMWESGMSDKFVLSDGQKSESLNGTGPTVALDNYPDVETPYEYSARAVIDQYQSFDMPLGYFLPNDGYGAGYGQNGYWMTGGVNPDGSSSDARLAAVDANVENLREFAAYAKEKGVETGLWTQSYLVPDSNPNTEWHRLRDFRKEVGAGVTTLKTDVAWVGNGYSMQLDGVKTAYDIATEVSGVRPNIISLDGWAGSQRYNGIWTGDQTGGKWEYIRFHIPTYIGTSLAGNPNVGSDMDGIFGGSALISTRDYQWKTFTQSMLNMDGWGAYAKMPYTFGDPYTGISRMYLKIKSQLMPYLYTTAYSSSNIEVGNEDAGLPMIRAMHLEFPDDDYAYSKNMQYQYMYGKNVLVAPVYQDTNAKENGDDVRDNIYLPDDKAVWVDFFTGKQYQGGQILNNYDAPLWKLPVFVKNGAIIPQYEANNSPSEINKANRIVEFWPEGETDYTAVEDDGMFVENNMTNDDEYGVIENVSYGSRVTTRYTSKVEGGKATLTAEKSTGAYEGYNQNKNTTFVVHVTKKPESITASNGASQLTATEAATKAAFDEAVPEAGKAVWFYDAEPKIETFASEDPEKEVKFKEMVANVKVAPKLYVKLAAADAQAVAQTVVVNGFENDGKLPADKPNSNLTAPVLADNTEAKTPTSITVDWEAVEGATSYDLMVDGRFNTVDGDALSFTYRDLDYASEHTFQIRSRNAEGYSEWSEEYTFVSAEDPWRNTPVPKKITWPGGLYGSHTANLAFDQIFQTSDGGFHSDDKAIGVPLTVEYDKAYRLDKIEYYPRDDGGNGTVTKMKLETSLDGVHWKEAGVYDWNRDNLMKTMELKDTAARFIRFTALASLGNFFSASEIKVYKKDGSTGFAVGSTNFNETVEEADKTNMMNYLGGCTYDKLFVAQIKNRQGDINANNIYDVYDYAFTMFQLEGGTKKKAKVGGKSTFEVSAEQVAADETFTVDFKTQNAAGVNALGQVITYDPSKVEFVSVKGAEAIAQMVDMCANKVYTDQGFAYANIAYVNEGNKDLYKGSGTVVTLTMRAKEDISTSDTDVLGLHGLILIGPNYDTNGEIGQEPVELVRQFSVVDFDITMTNEKLPTDDGTNVEKLIQGGSAASFETLFDGSIDRDFELLWDVDSNHDENGNLPEYVTLPMTMHFTLKEPAEIGRFTVYNANKANGYVTAASAKVNYTDGTFKEKDIRLKGSQQTNNAAFTFEDIFVAGKKVESVDVTIQEAIAQGGQKTTKMMTLAEVEVVGRNSSEVIPVPDKIARDRFDITMTNAELKTDDGDNVTKLIQQESYDGLFDEELGRDFEFKWDNEENWEGNGYLPSYVTLPVTMHFTMKEPTGVNKLIVHNANKGNGFVTSATATAVYTDGTFESQTITLSKKQQVDNAVFEFEDAFAAGKAIERVDVTFNKAITQEGEEISNMLTLAEIELMEQEIEFTKYTKNEFSVTMTNAELTEDDGTNVTKLIQQGNYEGLFNGTKTDRGFEFLWDIGDNYDPETGKLPSYVTLPLTMHFALNTPDTVSNLIVYNANKGNGFVTAVSATVHYEDGTSAEKEIELSSEEQVNYAAFAFGDMFNWNKKVTNIDVTFMKALGGGSEVTNMLTLAEIELCKGNKLDDALMKELAETAHKAAVSAEAAQKAAEQEAKTAQEAAEKAQEVAEKAKQDAEDAIRTAQTAQQGAEAAQAEAEAAEGRANDAADRAAAAQTAAEKAKEDAEAVLSAIGGETEEAKQAAQRAEAAQTAAEQAKEDAETAKGIAYTAKAAAEAAKTAAESARNEAQTAQSKAEEAQGKAEEAQGKAETAKTAAETARNEAVTAKDAAETARDLANGYATDAETAKRAAEEARKQAVAAQGKAEEAQAEAEAAKRLAVSEKDQAVAAKESAQAARDAAVNAKSEVEAAKNDAAESRRKAEAAAESAKAQVIVAQSAADTAKLYAEKAEAIKRQTEETARKVEEALKEANELLKKAQAEADARLAEMQKAIKAEADAKMAEMQTMLNQEKFKNSKVKLTVKAQTKKAKLSWKPIKGADGYEITYSLKSTMKNKKKVNVKGGSKIDKTLTNLKSGKTYYVRIKAYKKVGDKKIYTKVSAKKQVRVK